MESFDTRPDYNVQEVEYHRLLGWPSGHTPSDRGRELAAWARAWYAEHGRPWIYLRRVPLQLDADTLRLDGVAFASPRLHQHLRDQGAEGALLLAVSAGAECEEHARRLWEEGRPDEYFFLEVFGSAVVEDLVARLNGRLCGVAGTEGLAAIPHYSPGYSGWDVAEQNKLFALISHGLTRPFPGPLEVLASGMLRPKKSLLAVFGLAPAARVATGPGTSATPCERCGFSPCTYRRAPYRYAGERTASSVSAASSVPAPTPRAVPVSPLTRNATYSVNARALRKWAAERVRIDAREDGAIEVVFRFDGTTCSNMGHPLSFDYKVALTGADQGYRILRASCTPTAGDEGYHYTCSYRDEGDRHLETIAADQPLVGQPLDEILRWTRPSAPSGCHCTADSRLHKWGLALEVIHFALVQNPVPQPVS